MNDTPLGLSVEDEFQRTILILVPIFDGTKAMDESMREWLSMNFADVFDDLLYPKAAPKEKSDDSDLTVRERRRRRRKKKKVKIDPLEIHVKSACRRWWYYARDLVPKPNDPTSWADQQEEMFEDHLIPFYLLPIVKKNNHRKHNSHQWFFDSVCMALGDTCTYGFLTDCGTTYEPSCLGILFKELCINPDLIGVTARQRVEWPNRYFHPCEDAPFEWLHGSHDIDRDPKKRPCWKCYVTYLFGPAPLQGFEFEATLVTNLSIFNLVEALPVMPGPCQLMNWQKMKHFQVVKEYFSLLFKSEINKKELVNVPARYHKMVDDDDALFDDSSDDFISSSSDEYSEWGDGSTYFDDDASTWFDEELGRGGGSVTGGSTHGRQRSGSFGRQRTRSIGSTNGEIELGYNVYGAHRRAVRDENDDIYFPETPRVRTGESLHGEDQDETRSVASASSRASRKSLRRTASRYGPNKPPPPVNPITHSTRRPALNFTEFLRTNMRLAEDRVLSFVSVFSTRYGTKWIPGATFYYTPEIKWQTLLLQRRRWINGTFASFLFFLMSKRAETRLNARMFDDQSLAKALVLFLWKLQLFQMLLVFVSPAIFGSTAYIAVLDLAERFPHIWGWGNTSLFPQNVGISLVGADIWIFFWFCVYAGWSFVSHFIQGGRIPELVCHGVAILGLIYMIPIYWSLWSAIIALGVGFVAALVIFGLLAPAAISYAESWKCVKLYIAYLPWFLSLIVFMLIFIPGYSFARLYDTTWGNRATGSDSAIHANEEKTMRMWNLLFVIFLVSMNFFLTMCLVWAFRAGYNVVMGIMIFVFIPSVIQLLGAIAFWIKTFFLSEAFAYEVIDDIELLLATIEEGEGSNYHLLPSLLNEGVSVADSGASGSITLDDGDNHHGLVSAEVSRQEKRMLDMQAFDPNFFEVDVFGGEEAPLDLISIALRDRLRVSNQNVIVPHLALPTQPQFSPRPSPPFNHGYDSFENSSFHGSVGGEGGTLPPRYPRNHSTFNPMTSEIAVCRPYDADINAEEDPAILKSQQWLHTDTDDMSSPPMTAIAIPAVEYESEILRDKARLLDPQEFADIQTKYANRPLPQIQTMQHIQAFPLPPRCSSPSTSSVSSLGSYRSGSSRRPSFNDGHGGQFVNQPPNMMVPHQNPMIAGSPMHVLQQPVLPTQFSMVPPPPPPPMTYSPSQNATINPMFGMPMSLPPIAPIPPPPPPLPVSMPQVLPPQMPLSLPPGITLHPYSVPAPFSRAGSGSEHTPSPLSSSSSGEVHAAPVVETDSGNDETMNPLLMHPFNGMIPTLPLMTAAGPTVMPMIPLSMLNSPFLENLKHQFQGGSPTKAKYNKGSDRETHKDNKVVTESETQTSVKIGADIVRDEEDEDAPLLSSHYPGVSPPSSSFSETFHSPGLKKKFIHPDGSSDKRPVSYAFPRSSRKTLHDNRGRDEDASLSSAAIEEGSLVTTEERMEEDSPLIGHATSSRRRIGTSRRVQGLVKAVIKQIEENFRLQKTSELDSTGSDSLSRSRSHDENEEKEDDVHADAIRRSHNHDRDSGSFFKFVRKEEASAPSMHHNHGGHGQTSVASHQQIDTDEAFNSFISPLSESRDPFDRTATSSMGDLLFSQSDDLFISNSRSLSMSFDVGDERRQSVPLSGPIGRPPIGGSGVGRVKTPPSSTRNSVAISPTQAAIAQHKVK